MRETAPDLLPKGVEAPDIVLKRWTLILILAALPAFAGSEPPLKPGDVLATSFGPFACGPHAFGGGFGAAFYRRDSVTPSRFSGVNFGFPYPGLTGPVTYSPALNRMILGTFTGETVDNGGHIRARHATLEILDADVHLTPLLTLPDYAKVTTLAGVGSEILAVVVLDAPSYQRELWRIAATDGTVTGQIGLPLPPPGLPINDITSIDLAADRCTLAYAVPGEVIHRYDICTRRPLEDAATRTASAVQFLPQGNLLVSESLAPGLRPWSRLARYDREGRLVSTADLPLLPDESITAIALDPDGSTAWIVTSRGFAESCPVAARVMAVNASSGAFVAGPWQFGGGSSVGIAVAGQWRAAEQPVRGRAVR